MEPSRQQVLLEDLSALIDGVILLACVTALYSLRRQELSLCTLTYALSLALLTATVGHYLEQHVFGEAGIQDLVLYPSRSAGSVSVSLLVCAASIGALMCSLTRCQPLSFDCIAGEYAMTHHQCKVHRLRHALRVWLSSAAFLWAAAALRMNAVVGGSVLHPRGGGCALAVLRSPELAACVVAGACGGAWLHAQLAQVQAAQAAALRADTAAGPHTGSGSGASVSRRHSSAAAAPFSPLGPQRQQHGGRFETGSTCSGSISPPRNGGSVRGGGGGGGGGGAYGVPPPGTALGPPPPVDGGYACMYEVPPYSAESGGSSRGLRRRRQGDGSLSAADPCQHPTVLLLSSNAKMQFLEDVIEGMTTAATCTLDRGGRAAELTLEDWSTEGSLGGASELDWGQWGSTRRESCSPTVQPQSTAVPSAVHTQYTRGTSVGSASSISSSSPVGSSASDASEDSDQDEVEVEVGFAGPANAGRDSSGSEDEVAFEGHNPWSQAM
ncbi:hypothetical protein JKP88DRAFT_248419 [Tribonema minus]|uniref:Uncharacterized protein n=1 Tax=Tribonema minus TaxID=303371 RepID=A0A835YNW1_9STRA|nr:hypothetical protein JKP88DRAFT_248419 [Tribonema minus]